MRAEQSRRRRAWALAGLLIYCGIVGLIVLLPVSYSSIVNGIGDWMRYDLGWTFFGSGWIEFAANILMFVPLGLLLTLLFAHPWYGVVLALALSAAVELVQIVIPSRQASLRDVLANVIGAAIGAALAWLIVRREARSPVAREGVEEAAQP
jgi:glycopeptide antibiotics resistance protein